jgi:hypothetical protein
LWHFAQVRGTRVLKTGEAGSFGGRMPCTPWQLVQVATFASPRAASFACTLVCHSAIENT